jgi:uncharacterized protein YkwD
MMYVIEKKAGKKFKYNMTMADHARKHAEFMASQGKTVHTPENLLYCHENLGVISSPYKLLNSFKSTAAKVVHNWFLNTKSRQNIVNSDEMGIGIAAVENKGNTSLYIVQRMR